MCNYILHKRVDTHFNGIEKMGHYTQCLTRLEYAQFWLWVI